MSHQRTSGTRMFVSSSTIAWQLIEDLRLLHAVEHGM